MPPRGAHKHVFTRAEARYLVINITSKWYYMQYFLTLGDAHAAEGRRGFQGPDGLNLAPQLVFLEIPPALAT